MVSGTRWIVRRMSWVTVPVHEIGSLRGENAGFQRIADVRPGDGGNRIYVVDPLEKRVTVCSPPKGNT